MTPETDEMRGTKVAALRIGTERAVGVDGAGASCDVIEHLLSLGSLRRKVLFTYGWMIIRADEDAIKMLSAAWKAGLDQDGKSRKTSTSRRSPT